MPNQDPLLTRPTLVNAALLTHAVNNLSLKTGSSADVWHALTERYVVDLDAVAALLPREESDPIWLTARD